MMAKIEWYEEILSLEPGSKVFFPFAKRLAEDGLHDKALAVLRHGLVQHPEYLEARVFLTHLLFAIGDTESAMAESQLVFGRLAPYPAFWEALSLAHEAVPGDMTLAMRFMAEALRAPGLTFASTMRRGLAPQSAEPVPTAPEGMPSVAEEVAAETVVPEAEACEIAPVAETEASVVPEESCEADGSEVLDPLAPVTDVDETPVESIQAGASLAEALLPLDDDDIPMLPDTVPAPVEEPVVLPVENVETVLADAASVDEALAELDGALDSLAADAAETEELESTSDGTASEVVAEAADTSAGEPLVLSEEDLEELDKTIFGEADEAAGQDEGEVDLADLPSLEELSELAELADVDKVSGEDEENPLLTSEAEDVMSAESAPALETQAETIEEETQADAAPAPSFYLDGGLLDLTDADDVTPEASEQAEGLAEAVEEALPEAETLSESADESSESAENFAETPLKAAEPAEKPLELADVVAAEDEVLALSPEALSLVEAALTSDTEPEPEEVSSELAQEPIEVAEAVEPTVFQSAVHVHIQPANVTEELDEPVVELTDPIADSAPAADADGADADMADDMPVRTRSMAEVLAEQGDIDGALAIYEELLHKAAPDEAASLGERMDILRGQKTAEKPEPKPSSRSDKAGLRSMLENLAGRLEKRAKA